MKAIFVSGNVSDDNCTSVHSFKLSKLIFEPFNLITRVISILNKFPVQVVASLSVDPDDLSMREDATVLQLKNL